MSFPGASQLNSSPVSQSGAGHKNGNGSPEFGAAADSSHPIITILDSPTRMTARKLEYESGDSDGFVPFSLSRDDIASWNNTNSQPKVTVYNTSFPGLSPSGPLPPARNSFTASTTSTAVYTTTTTIATTTTTSSGLAPTQISHRTDIGAHPAMGLPARNLDEASQWGYAAAPMFDGKSLYCSSEEELINAILDRDEEVLIQEESMLIGAAAVQTTSTALEMLMERPLVFQAYDARTNRGWHREDCPLRIAIDNERPENLLVLLRFGVRPDAELSSILHTSAVPHWAREMFMQPEFN